MKKDNYEGEVIELRNSGANTPVLPGAMSADWIYVDKETEDNFIGREVRYDSDSNNHYYRKKGRKYNIVKRNVMEWHKQEFENLVEIDMSSSAE